MKYRVPFIKPDFPKTEDVAADYQAILASNWFTNFGPFEERFAQRIGDYIGEGFTATTFSNATSALLAASLAVFGKGNGEQYVLMPSFTFAAGADILIWCGFKPLFVDINVQGLHMDLAAAETLLNDQNYQGKIAGILFGNSFGVGTTNIDDWERLADTHALPLLIDSAAGFGSRYSSSRKVGSAGTCEIFSFHATKPFAIGEGGAAVTRDQKLAAQLRAIQNFGFDDRKNITTLGFNGKLQEINAAIGLRQFERFDTILKNRKKVFKYYQEHLDKAQYTLQENAEAASLCFASVIVNDAKQRDNRLSRLREAGVDAKTYYSPALHQQGYFKQYGGGRKLDVTDLVVNSILSLPIHDSMSQVDIDLIVTTLNGQKS